MANSFKVTVLGEDEAALTVPYDIIFPEGLLIKEDTIVVGCNASVRYGGRIYHFAETVDDIHAALTDNPVAEEAATKVFTALLTQAGTGNPTWSTLDNTYADLPTITRQSAGLYRVTLEDAYTENYTFFVPLQLNDGTFATIDTTGFPVYFEINTVADDKLTKSSFEVRTYLAPLP